MVCDAAENRRYLGFLGGIVGHVEFQDVYVVLTLTSEECYELGGTLNFRTLRFKIHFKKTNFIEFS